MKKFWSGSLMAAALGTALTAVNPAPASAQLARPQVATDLTGGKALVTEVQYRRGWRGGYRYGRYPYRGYRYNRGWGPAAGVGIGLATGALIGGALAAAPRTYYGPGVTADEVAYCSRRFKSYDPSSGTSLGYDGNRHACP